MSQFIQPSYIEESQPARRIFARLDAKVSWKDRVLRESINVYGQTVNLSENSVLVGVEVLPPVGQPVEVTLSDGDKDIITISAEVIRVERDPAKPKAALGIGKDRSKWQEIVLPAAQEWVTNDMKVNYEGDDWLN
jgi:hypothetical protein